MKRLAVIAALALSACSPAYDVCGPSTCDGCCTAAGECVGGDYDLACGTGGNACNVCPASAPVCAAHVCRAADVVDAGSDAGMNGGADAGPQVFVTLRYHYAKNPTNCPPDPPAAEFSCVIAEAMPKAKFDSVRLDYLECTTTQPTTDGYDIECGTCTVKSETCTWDFPDGGATPVTRGYFECPKPAHTTLGACEWTP